MQGVQQIKRACLADDQEAYSTPDSISSTMPGASSQPFANSPRIDLRHFFTPMIKDGGYHGAGLSHYQTQTKPRWCGLVLT
jgi:hypothetical protein